MSVVCLGVPSVSKKIVATFISKTGHLATIPLQDQRTVTADWYTTICLPEVIAELRKTNPERRIILYQDNASPHTARKTIRRIVRPSCVQSHRFLTFPKIKNGLRGRRFQTSEEAVNALKKVI